MSKTAEAVSPCNSWAWEEFKVILGSLDFRRPCLNKNKFKKKNEKKKTRQEKNVFLSRCQVTGNEKIIFLSQSSGVPAGNEYPWLCVQVVMVARGARPECPAVGCRAMGQFDLCT